MFPLTISSRFFRNAPPVFATICLAIGGIDLVEVKAQPIPSIDGTGTIVTDTITPEGDRFEISGGSQSLDGTNLFHSFEQFGLEAGQVATFLANPDIRNILSRVVGGDTSFIDGLVQVTGGNAHLYLINPAGIIFGNGATLDVPGSFTATTATGIGFQSEVLKSLGSNDYSLLVGDPSSLIFAVVKPGAIVNAGQLSVQSGQSLTLAGGQVLNLGGLTAPGGSITVMAVPGQSAIRLTPEGRVLSLDLSLTGLEQSTTLKTFEPRLLPDLLTGDVVAEANDLAVREDGSVWLVTPSAEVALTDDPSLAIVSGRVNGTAVSASPDQPDSSIGGNVVVWGNRLGLVDAIVEASGDSGGGQIQIGSTGLGEGSLPANDRTFVSEGTQLQANGLTNGSGGQVTIAADRLTRFAGTLSAQGGSEGGPGGVARIGANQDLVYRGNVNLQASQGEWGSALVETTALIIAKEEPGEENNEPLIEQDIFGENGISTITLTPENVVQILGNAHLILKANNDLILNNEIQALVDRKSGTLTLQSGRSLIINDNLILGNPLTATANAGAENGILETYREPGDAIVHVAAEKTIETTANNGNITVTIAGENTVANQNSGDLTIEGALNAGSGTITLENTDGRIWGTGTIGGAVANLTANQIGTGSQPIQTQVNRLNTNTIATGGNQFLVNRNGLTALNLQSGQEGTVSLTVQGAIVDSDTDLDIVAKQAKLETTTGIGLSSRPLDLQVETIAAQATNTGGIFLQQFGNLTIDTVEGLSDLTTGNGAITIQVNNGLLTINDGLNEDQIGVQAGNTGNISLQANSIQLNTNILSGKNQTYDGAITTGNDITIASENNGTIVFQSTIDADHIPRSLGIQTGGVTQFNGAIGQISPLNHLETDNQGVRNERTVLDNSPVITIGNQTYHDPVRIATNTSLTGQTIHFGSSIDSQTDEINEVTIDAEEITISGSIGQNDRLSRLTLKTEKDIRVEGDIATTNTLSLTSENGFIKTGYLTTEGGNINLQAGQSNTSLSNSSGLQSGDIEIRAALTNGGSFSANSLRFFRAIDTLNSFSISTIGNSNNGDNSGDSGITIIHNGQRLNQSFIVGDVIRTNNGTTGSIRSNLGIVPRTQAFPGSITTGDITVLAGRDNPPVDIQLIPPNIGDSLTAANSTLSSLENIEDSNTIEFQNAFGKDPVRQATPEKVQDLLKSINDPISTNTNQEKFAAVYIYYTRFSDSTASERDTIFSRGRVLRPDDPPLEEDNLSILIVTEKEIKALHLPPAINRLQVSKEIQFLRNRLREPDTAKAYEPHAINLYNWIAQPIIEALGDQPIDNLMFILGRGLRSIPLAVLYNQDRQEYLVEEYGLTLVPSISYLDEKAVSLRNVPVLAMGASVFANNENVPLPAVPTELKLISDTRPTRILQEDQFTFGNLQRSLNQYRQFQQLNNKPQPLLLHLATHADFGQKMINNSLNPLTQIGETRNISYLQFFDRKLSFEDLQKIELNKGTDVELFAISACNTATGDDEAELGFAGLSLQMGAQSALASLWQVSDVGTMALMGEFYAQLNLNVNRVQALRQAQLAILHGRAGIFQQNRLNLSQNSILLSPDLAQQTLFNYPNLNRLDELDLRHPFYWSSFTLIGSPW